ncbi:hypothetical protein LCGC14_0874130 [marine sediment metagenome]|uniref:Mannose-6-phosphate isomerase type II C-terminal domain-containing protein n=1 Tax=marine sediment metagenome TaxID=412755 RepID=A0A0F9PPH0_9ZZZZ
MPHKIEKPWGHELIWAQEPSYVAKMIYIKKGHRLSLQKHERKSETIYILSGVMQLRHGDTIREMRPGDTSHIGPNTIHRFEAVEDTELVEVSTSDLDDVIRFEDDYERIESTS